MSGRRVISNPGWLVWAKRTGKVCKACHGAILQLPAVSNTRERSGRMYYHLDCARRVNLLRRDELRMRVKCRR